MSDYGVSSRYDTSNVNIKKNRAKLFIIYYPLKIINNYHKFTVQCI